MKLRPFITLLLMFILATTAASLPSQKPEDAPVDKVEEKITAEEEREAREIAALLDKRWQETEDIGPLIKGFFVGDFADRLRHEREVLYFAEIKPELLVYENRDELQRHYVAMTNFVHIVFRVYSVYEIIQTSEEEHDIPELNEIIPPTIWNVLKSNPNMRALLAEETGEKREDEGDEQDADKRDVAKTVKTIEELRSLTATLEQANVLLRDHLKTLPSTLSASEMRKEQNDAAENDDEVRPRVYVLHEDFYGYPSGTRLICLNLQAFHVDLVRDGERLKVLSIYIQSD